MKYFTSNFNNFFNLVLKPFRNYDNKKVSKENITPIKELNDGFLGRFLNNANLYTL